MKDESVYLRHILQAIGKIQRYTAKGRRAFIENSMIQDAVVRNLEIIGEAVAKLPVHFKQRYPAVPWRKITALRNILIHEYFGVDIQIVWRVVRKRIPWLKSQIKALLKKSSS